MKIEEDLILESENFKLLMETLEECMREFLSDRDIMVQDIMHSKSVSIGEALPIAHKFALTGIKPKSDEFYKEVDNIKTLW